MTHAEIKETSLTFSEKLADYICNEQFSNIDANSVQRAKQRLVYHLGLAFRGLTEREPDIERAVAIARQLSDDAGTSTLIGLPYRTTVLDAVFANCQMMRSFGRDDVIFETGVHPGLMTLPVAYSLAERHHSSGAEFITAIIVGYEMMGKFARWSWTLDAPRRATMPFGPFGSVATASRLLNLDEAQTAVAIAYAAHTAMGVAEGNAGPISHYYGLVCRNGIIGSYLSKAGAWGSPLVLEGEFGFIETFLGDANVDQDAMVGSMGANYSIMTSEEKHYPGTGLNQVPIELVRKFVVEENLRAADVASIHITFPTERLNFKISYSKGPFSVLTAPSSALFNLGILLLDGDLNLDRYTDIDNPEIHRIMQSTELEFVDGKSVRYARVEVRTTDGRKFVGEGNTFTFEPESPETIMRREASEILTAAKIDQFLELLDDIENCDDVSSLTAYLVPS